jgi:nucleoside-diphosphate-sugar epimerase
MRGDGDKDGGRYSTVSLQLMKDILHVMFLCGINVGAVCNEDAKIWRIPLKLMRNPSPTIKYHSIQIERDDNPKDVYCITVAKNNIIYAGRNYKFNWIGQCDTFTDEQGHVIPMLIKRFVEAKENNLPEVVCWGTGNATREFLYAGDCAKAIVLATEKYDKPEPMNIGSGQEITIKALAEMIADLVGYKGKIVFDSSMPDGQPRRYLNVMKALKELRWVAATPLKVGLEKTISWYLDNRDKVG